MNLAQAAKHLCNASANKTYADAFPSSNEITEAVAAAFSNTMTEAERSALLINPSLTTSFAFITPKGTLGVINKPSPATASPPADTTDPSPTSIMLGDFGQTIDTIHPARVSSTALKGWFTTLVPFDEALSLQLPTSEADPGTLCGPPSDTGEKGCPPSYERLQFAFSADEEGRNRRPVIAALLNACPIPLGVKLPEGLHLTDDLTPDTCAADFIRTWWKGHQYIFKHNQGLSVTKGGSLFDVDDRSSRGRRHPPTNAWVTAGFPQEIHPSILLAPHISFLEMLTPDTPHYKAVMTIMQQERDRARTALWDRALEDLPDQQNTNQPEHNVPGLAEFTTAANALASVITNQSTNQPVTQPTPQIPLRDKEHIQASQDTLHRFSLTCAKVTEIERETVIVVGEPTEPFQELIRKTNNTHALNLFRDDITMLQNEAMESRDITRASQNFPTEVFASPMILSNIKIFQFLSVPAIVNPDQLLTHISAFTFLPVNTASSEFQDRRDTDLTILTQEAMGEHSANIPKKRTTLYLSRCQHSIDDALTTASNIFLFFTYVYGTDFHQTLLGKHLQEYDDLLRKPSTRKWFSQWHRTYPALAHYLILGLQSILAPFFKLASLPELRKAVADNRPIAFESFIEAIAAKQSVIDTLNRQIHNGTVTDWSGTPSTFAKCFPNQKPRPKTNSHQPPPSTPPLRTSTSTHTAPPPPTRPAATSRSTITPNDTTNKGFILNPNKRRVDPPRSLPVHPKDKPNQPSRLCFNYIFQGRTCKHGTACTFLHPNSINDIYPASERRKLQEWVQNHPDLSLSTSSSPPSGQST